MTYLGPYAPTNPRPVLLGALWLVLGSLSFPFAWNSGNLISGHISAVASMLCWIPLFQMNLNYRNVSEAFRKNLLWIMPVFFVNVSWATVAMKDYGHMNYLASISVVLAWSFALAFFSALALAFAFWPPRQRYFSLWLIACLTLAQWLLSFFPLKGCPWLLPAYSWYHWIYPIQIVDTIGVLGLSSLIFAINVCVWQFFQQRQGRYLAFSLLLILAMTAYGQMRLEQELPKNTFRVAVVQGNITQDLKWTLAGKKRARLIYAEQSEAMAAAKPDLLIGPEAAIPKVFKFDIGRASTVPTDFLDGNYLLFGAPSIERRGRESHFYNTAFLLDDHQNVRDRYFKQILVPFGEYIPWTQIIPLDKWLPPVAGNFTSGYGPHIFQLRQTALGVLICYESLFPRLSRAMVGLGAEFLVNMTNDAWFNHTAGPFQHLHFLKFRAIETRRSIVRAANTGFSGWYDRKGRLHQRTDLFTDARFFADIPLNTGYTFFIRFPHLALLFSLFIIVLYGKQLWIWKK